jgi:hypothetical protein
MNLVGDDLKASVYNTKEYGNDTKMIGDDLNTSVDNIE